MKSLLRRAAVELIREEPLPPTVLERPPTLLMRLVTPELLATADNVTLGGNAISSGCRYFGSKPDELQTNTTELNN